MQTAPQRRHTDQPAELFERARLIAEQVKALGVESFNRGHCSEHVLDGCDKASELLLGIANTLKKAGV